MMGMTLQDPPPAPPPPPDPSPQRVVRATEGKYIAGVSAGLGHHFGLDPVLIRIAFVVLTLFGGSGVVLYGLLWLLLPTQDKKAVIRADTSTSRRAGAIVLILIAVVALPFTGPGILVAGPALLAVAVIGALVVLAWRAVGGEGEPGITRAAVLVLAVAGSLLLGLGAGAVAAFGGGAVVAGVVIAAGAALVVGGFVGGARWLVVPALVMAIPVSIVAAADVDLSGGVGERTYRPQSVVDLDDSYRLGVGEMKFDLSDLQLPTGRTDLDISVGVGRVELRLPKGTCLQLRSHIGVGEVKAFGRVNDGLDVDVDRRPAPGPAQPVLDVDANVGMGQIEILGPGARSARAGCRS